MLSVAPHLCSSLCLYYFSNRVVWFFLFFAFQSDSATLRLRRACSDSSDFSSSGRGMELRAKLKNLRNAFFLKKHILMDFDGFCWFPTLRVAVFTSSQLSNLIRQGSSSLLRFFFFLCLWCCSWNQSFQWNAMASNDTKHIGWKREL